MAGFYQTSRFDTAWVRSGRQVSIFTLVMLPLAVLRARRHQVVAHRNTMIGLFLGALVVAGLLTLVPGRVMHEVVFGAM